MIKYQSFNSMFHKLDPLSKLIWLVCISILSLYYVDAVKQAILLSIILLTATIAANFTLAKLWRSMRLPLLLGMPYFVIQLLFYPGKTEWLAIGPVIITYEALNFAGAISVRLLILVLVSIIYIVTTDPRDVVLALAQKLRLPYRFAFTVSIALRFIPIIGEEARLIQEAQRLRGRSQPHHIRGKVSWQLRFMKAVFIGAVRRVEQMAIAMDLRGFGHSNQRTYRRTIAISIKGYILSIVSIMLTLIGIIII